MARLARPDVQLDLHTLEIIAPYALAAALVGPDSLLTVKLVDDISDTHSDKTRESLGQGAANVITGVSAAEPRSASRRVAPEHPSFGGSVRNADGMTPVGNLPRSDADLAAALAMSVVRLDRRLRSEGIDDLRVGVGAVAVLALLHREGERTVGELARLERVRPPSMTRTVARLEANGHVERFAHPTDGRRVLVRLSDRGGELLAAERRRRDAWLASRLRKLTADERALLRHAASVLDRLAGAGDGS